MELVKAAALVRRVAEVVNRYDKRGEGISLTPLEEEMGSACYRANAPFRLNENQVENPATVPKRGPNPRIM